ncbi:MAG: hypothetical protein ACHQ8D_05155 [Candidatus Rokuibacteriota bacterium]
MLDDYRRGFGPAYELVVHTVREKLSLQPTGRPAKSTGAIVEKLHRETIRLSQVQDVAGCRIVVDGIPEQDKAVAALAAAFPKASIVDRRIAPTHGYRAVHVVAEVSGKLVEIQVRTALQHTWAELSEKLSDVLDPAIKYGGGPDDVKEALKKGSAAVNSLEETEVQVAGLLAAMAQRAGKETPEADKDAAATLRARLVVIREQLHDALRASVSTWVARGERPGQ